MPDPTPHTSSPRRGSSLYMAWLASGSNRQAMGHWLRWWHEVSAIPYTVSDPSVAERKLAWWGQTVAQAFDVPPQHPLLKAMAQPQGVLKGPPLAWWLEQIEGLGTLTQQTRWLDEATLVRHMAATTGAACQGAAWIMGSRDERTWAVARSMGEGLRRCHILARLGQDTQAGWLHTPIDVLQAHNVKAHELLRPASPLPTDNIQHLLGDWHQRANAQLEQALAQARALPRDERMSLRPLVVLVRLNQALLNDLKAQGYAVLKQRILLGPWRKLWLAQTTSWRWS